MERYDFKYGRVGLVLMLPVVLVILLIQIGDALYLRLIMAGMSNGLLNAIYMTLFIAALVIPFVVFFNFKAHAILHKNHVEVNLGFGIRTREIEYSKIRGITHGFNTNGFHWRIEVEGERNLFISLSLSHKSNKVLEQFMEDLKQKSPRLRK